jgi:hypothetical protein
MCLHASLAFIIKARDKIAEEHGILSKDNKSNTTFDIIKALACRLECLESIGLLTPRVDDPDYFLFQLMEDALQIFSVKNTNATVIVLKPIFDDSYLTEKDPDCVISRFNLFSCNVI